VTGQEIIVDLLGNVLIINQVTKIFNSILWISMEQLNQ